MYAEELGDVGVWGDEGKRGMGRRGVGESHGVHLTTGNAPLSPFHTQSDAQTQSRTKALLGF